jgi:chemotaxis protein histidine kinase CheA
MARARAEVFAKKAAEADAAAIIAKTKDQTTAIDKTRDNIKKNSAIVNAIPILGSIIVATNDLVGGSEETLAQKQKKRVKEKEKSLKKEADMYGEEAKKALETAIKLEHTNEISNKSQQKKTDTHKSNSAARIKEAENEAKRLYDIEVKANEARIKKEDEQFDLMNKLTMTQQEQDKLALMQDYDKKFAIAEGNAELEKLLTEQQKKDLADINKKYADEATKKTEEDAAKIKAEEEKKAAALKQAQDLIFNMNATQQEKDMRALEEKYKEEQKIIGDNAAAQLQLAEKFEADKKDIEKKYTLEKIENARKEREAKLTLAADIANGINTVGAAFIKDQKKLEKFNKANALIQIGIDTGKAISSLVAASNANPLNAPTAGAAGIAQFATGIIQIATNIAKAKQILTSGGTPTSGGGGGGGTGGGGESANVAQSVPQAAQLFGSANAGGTMSAGGTTNESSMTVTAVVSETQVTNVQNKINKINKNAEL